jgi:hypothetical protein
MEGKGERAVAILARSACAALAIGEDALLIAQHALDIPVGLFLVVHSFLWRTATFVGGERVH